MPISLEIESKECGKTSNLSLNISNRQTTQKDGLTTTASQGQTIRAAVTIDCARNEPQGQRGTTDDAWWLNLYVMFSRVTRMSDMLLLRPPPRTLLERGPPASVRKALKRFEKTERDTVADAVLLAKRFDISLPEE